MAEFWEMRPPGRNPCRSVRRYKVEPHKERFLTPRELAQLGRTLDIAPEKRLASRHAAAAVRLLVLTGCRRNEIMGTAWDDLDFEAGEMQLADSKVGPRIVPMPPAAAEVLAELPRVSGNRWVFPGRKKGTHQTNINDSWNRIREHAGPNAFAFTTCVTASPAGRSRSARVADDRRAARPPARQHHRALRPFRPGVGAGLDGPGRGQHRRGHPDRAGRRCVATSVHNDRERKRTMATLNTQRISCRTVEALYWDSDLSGFGIRVYPSGSKVYLVQTRKDGMSRRLTVGQHGLISADRARTEAAFRLLMLTGCRRNEILTLR